VTDFTDNDTIDFTDMIAKAKQATQDYYDSIGVKMDLSNAVTTGTLGGFVIENKTDCPVYLAGITEGWWFAKWTGRDDGPFIVEVVESGFEGLHVKQVGNELPATVATEVADGMRFLIRVEFPEGI
jgi:hypothetical protein